jgi:uncharacterized membrane protein YgcG
MPRSTELEGTMNRTVKLIAGVAGLAVIAVAVVLLTSTGKATANEVRFQNVSDPGPKPFTAATDSPATSKQTGGTSSTASTTSSTVQSTTVDRTTGQIKPGAFTGPTHCDREKLIAELIADPQKLKTWADVLGIDGDPQSVASYIRTLRPVVLSQDTQVTNHSYIDGDVKGYQAILPKGTPVLANADGEPVVRCRCGNPLTKPVELETHTTCINCPANYQPSAPIQHGDPCQGSCFHDDPSAPKADPPADPIKTTPDPIAGAKSAFQTCVATKGTADQCKTEYEKTRGLCEKSPLNKACDSSICFDAIVDIAQSGCSTYFGGDDVLKQCLSLDQNAKTACLQNLRGLQTRCVANPGRAECMTDPNLKAFKLRRKCTADPTRPECVAVQASCVPITPENSLGCQPLRTSCTTKPDRPDCKGLQDIQTACAKDKTKPECQILADPNAPNAPAQKLQALAGDQNPNGQTGDQQGATSPDGQQTPPIDNGGGQPGAGQPGGNDPGGQPNGGGSSGSGGGQDQTPTPNDSQGNGTP